MGLGLISAPYSLVMVGRDRNERSQVTRINMAAAESSQPSVPNDRISDWLRTVRSLVCVLNGAILSVHEFPFCHLRKTIIIFFSSRHFVFPYPVRLLVNWWGLLKQNGSMECNFIILINLLLQAQRERGGTRDGVEAVNRTTTHRRNDWRWKEKARERIVGVKS